MGSRQAQLEQTITSRIAPVVILCYWAPLVTTSFIVNVILGDGVALAFYESSKIDGVGKHND